MRERLQKTLAAAGYGSRRECELLIVAGRVRVNGEVVSELGSQADPGHDAITIDGKLVKSAPLSYVMLYKPRGYTSTRKDPHARKTVIELLPERFSHLYPVGRLDVDSEGLLLLTNDGEMANRLTHPRFEAPKTYRVVVSGIVTEGTLRTLRQGVELDDGLAKPAGATVAGRDTALNRSRVEITLTEGRKHEVRRMMEALGHEVLRLVRVRLGPLTLAGLKPGKWRELTREERERLQLTGPRG